MSQMLKSSGAMAVATMVSRVLGLGREIVYAAFLGVGWIADAFFTAFMIPNLFRRLLGEGALTAAFIEGVCLFAVVVCLLVQGTAGGPA